MTSLPSQFSIYDLFALWLPGAFLTTSLWAIRLDQQESTISDWSAATVGLIAIFIGVTVGCLIQCLAKYLDKFANFFLGFPSDNFLTEKRKSKLSERVRKQNAQLSEESDFFTAWIWVTEHSTSDRAQRFYALSMLHRGLAVAVFMLLSYAILFVSMSPNEYVAVVVAGLVCSFLLFLRSRSFLNHYAKDVYYRYMLNAESEAGNA
jgi:uncharacterized membrane protein